MNILMVTKIDISRPTGETEHFLGLANAFAKLGHNVTILCPESSAKEKFDENKIEFRFIKSTQSVYKSVIFQLMLIFYMPFLLLRKKPDLVYIRMGPFLIIPIVLAKFLGYRVASEVNGLLQDDMKTIYNPPRAILLFSEICERLSYLLSDKIITVTDGLKNFIIKKYTLRDKNKIGVFSNGVDTNFYHIKKKKHESFNVLFMGGSSKWQGIETLQKAIIITNSKKKNINFTIITDKRIDMKNVNWFAKMDRNKIRDLFRYIDIAVAPYNRFRAVILSPIKIYTYIAGGIPVISSGEDKISWLLEKHKAGLNIEPDNPQKLSESIIFLFDNRDKILPIMSKNARHLSEKYDWKIIASKIIDFMYN